MRPVIVLDDRDFVYDIDYARMTDEVAFSHLGSRDFHLGLWTLGPAVQRVADPALNSSDFDVEAVAASPDGRLFAAASRDGWVRFFSREGRPGASYRTAEPLTAVAWHPEGRFVLAGSARGLVTAVSRDGVKGPEVRAHEDEIRGLGFAANGVAYSGGWDRSIAVLAPEGMTLKVARRFAVDLVVNDLSVDAHGDFLGVALGDKKAERNIEVYRNEKSGRADPIRQDNVGALVSVSAGAIVARYPRHTGLTSTAGVSPDGLYVATGGWDGKVYVFGYGVEHNPVAQASFGWIVRKVRFSSDGRYLLVAAWTPQLASESRHSDPSAVVYRLDYEPGVELRDATPRR